MHIEERQSAAEPQQQDRPQPNGQPVLPSIVKGCPHLALPELNASRTARDKRRLTIAICLCLVSIVAEIIGGLWSGSLAIFTDVAHLLSDIAGFLISLFALTWSTKPANARMSFGYHRAEILGALLSIALVWTMTIYLIIEAIERIRKPSGIKAHIMIPTAILGLLVNIAIALTLHDSKPHHHHHHHDPADSDSHQGNDPERPLSSREETTLAQPGRHQSPSTSLNIRAAVIHAVGDIVQSVGVLLASVVIWWRPDWTLADPLCTFLFSLLVFGSTLLVSRDAVHILMEGSPQDVDLGAMEADLRTLPGVRGIHDLHVWSLAAGKPAATLHVLRAEDHDSDAVLMVCQSLLCTRYNIHHAAIQVESRIDTRYHCHSHHPVLLDHPETENVLPW